MGSFSRALIFPFSFLQVAAVLLCHHRLSQPAGRRAGAGGGGGSSASVAIIARRQQRPCWLQAACSLLRLGPHAVALRVARLGLGGAALRRASQVAAAPQADEGSTSSSSSSSSNACTLGSLPKVRGSSVRLGALFPVHTRCKAAQQGAVG